MKKLSLLFTSLLFFGMIESYGGIWSVTTTNITENSALISWETDMETTTEMRLGVLQTDGSYIYTNLPKLNIADTKHHEYPLEGLISLTSYQAIPMSLDPAIGDYVPCDDASSPINFITLGPSGPVTSLDIMADSYTIGLYEWVYIRGHAHCSQGPAYGRDVSFAVTNGAPGGSPRGLFSPVTVVTDVNGDFNVLFSGRHYGKAHIEVEVEGVVESMDIMILPDRKKSAQMAENDVESDYRLGQNYPNPVSSSTTIEFEIPYDADVAISILDLSGKEHFKIVNRYLAGSHTFVLDVSPFDSGTYFYKFESGDFVEMKAMSIIK